MSEHYYCKGFYKLFIWLANFLSPFVLLAFRLFWGWLFILAGIDKFSDMDKVVEFFTQLNLPAPTFNAYLVATVELVGGAALFLGFASRLITLPLIIIMVVALFTAHAQATFHLLSDPLVFIAQAPVTYLMATLTVFLYGPGCFSIDCLIEKVCCKNQCGCK